MTDTIVKLRYTFRCIRCGHEWTEDQNVAAPGVEHCPPAVPMDCECCDGRLHGNEHAWGRTFEVAAVHTPP